MTFPAGPDPSQDDRTPGPWQVWGVRVEFSADRGGDAAGIRRVRLGWDSAPTGSREHALLLDLWALWSEQTLKQARAEGVPDAGFW